MRKLYLWHVIFRDCNNNPRFESSLIMKGEDIMEALANLREMFTQGLLNIDWSKNEHITITRMEEKLVELEKSNVLCN